MLVHAVRKRTPRSRSSRASCVIASWPPSHLLVHLSVCAKQRSLGLPQSRRRAWPQERRACSGGGLTCLSVCHLVCNRSPQPSYVALSAAVPPGHPCSAPPRLRRRRAPRLTGALPLPHPATPVQHQPTSRS